MDFVALDVETANADMASICQIGAARYANGALINEWKTYVDPQDYFDGMNVDNPRHSREHRSWSADVPGSIWNLLRRWLSNAVVVTHTHFDRTALHQAAAKYGLAIPSCTVARQCPCCSQSVDRVRGTRGYGLANVCRTIGYEFRHHDALEDAKAAGTVVLAALQKTGLDLAGMLRKNRLPHHRHGFGSGEVGLQREGNIDGPLYGEVLVFTGALHTPREHAADIAANLGCQVAGNVSKATTLLAVGDQDVTRLAGHSKSSKHRKAEELIAKGVPIRILREVRV